MFMRGSSSFAMAMTAAEIPIPADALSARASRISEPILEPCDVLLLLPEAPEVDFPPAVPPAHDLSSGS